MDEPSSYLALAKTTTADEFAARFDHLFLVKRPKKKHAQVAASPPVPISFETRHTKMEVDPYAAEWRIAPVKKRQGNPYPDRFSIGRAPNCDVVIRLPSISKVHAHIQIESGGTFSLRDNDASNATYVNGRKLESKGTAPIKIGDEIAFGSLELEFADAKHLYRILRSEVLGSKSPPKGSLPPR